MKDSEVDEIGNLIERVMSGNWVKSACEIELTRALESLFNLESKHLWIFHLLRFAAAS